MTPPYPPESNKNVSGLDEFFFLGGGERESQSSNNSVVEMDGLTGLLNHKAFVQL